MHFSFDHNLFLENAVARLQPIKAEDVDHLLAVATRDKDLLQFSPSQIHTPDLLRTYVDNALGHRANRTRYTFIVFDKTRQAYAGSTSFLNVSNPDDRLEIGATWYGRDFQRTGLNRNCKFLLLQYAFDELHAMRVEFRTDERNTASRRAIEAIGGQFEGLLRQHTVMSDGFRRNTACYSILKPEWTERKDRFLDRRD